MIDVRDGGGDVVFEWCFVVRFGRDFGDDERRRVAR